MKVSVSMNTEILIANATEQVVHISRATMRIVLMVFLPARIKLIGACCGILVAYQHNTGFVELLAVGLELAEGQGQAEDEGVVDEVG